MRFISRSGFIRMCKMLYYINQYEKWANLWTPMVLSWFVENVCDNLISWCFFSYNFANDWPIWLKNHLIWILVHKRRCWRRVRIFLHCVRWSEWFNGIPKIHLMHKWSRSKSFYKTKWKLSLRNEIGNFKD